MKLILFTNLTEMPNVQQALLSFGAPGYLVAFVTDCEAQFINDAIPQETKVLLLYERARVNNLLSQRILNWINNDPSVFVVIHRSSDGDLKVNHRAVFANTNAEIIEQSHTRGSIFHEIDTWFSGGCNSESLQVIIKKHFPNKKLIAVLEFLHQCLDNKIPDGELKPLKDAGIPIDDKDEISKAFEALKEYPDNKNEHLITLRDALLCKLGIG